MDRPDATLIRLMNAGDPGAFAELYERHKGWVCALAMRFTGNRDDALDVLQETFAYFFGRFPGFELTSTVRGYLFSVVRSRAIDLIRRRREVIDLDAVRAAASTLPWHPEPNSDLQRLVAGLPEEHRQVVLLRFGAQLKLGEIAESLGLAVGTVKSRLHNALKKLRSGLEDQKKEEP